MRILIAYGSKRGGTEGLAHMIGREFIDAGYETVVAPAPSVHDVDSFDAVVIAGALYANRWHTDARRFARRHAAVLRQRPVWLVSSGPLDDTATRTVIAPVAQVAAVMRSLGASGHMTFGGRLERDAHGLVAHAMARRIAGDWRDSDHVHRWAHEVMTSLSAELPAHKVGAA